MAGVKRKLLDGANKVLNRAGLELVKKGTDFRDYIPFRKTLQDVEKSGLSLADYIDNNFNVPGTTQLTVDKMAELGVFNRKINRVCELGPGSGRKRSRVRSRSVRRDR